MSIAMVRDLLLWCSLINYGLLILWFVLFLLPHDWLYRLWGKWFHLRTEQFDAISFAGIIVFKIGILLFNVVPYIALRIVGGV
jgi:hypothetical protein